MADLVRLFKNDFSEFKMIPSSGGVFEVRLGDRLLFSKKALGRFPEENEIIELVKKEV
ncbi:Rdx family protein [Psychrilyobacter sp. S5]|nr:Rdx family protein [Psychrilyobacter sp. S5]